MGGKQQGYWQYVSAPSKRSGSGAKSSKPKVVRTYSCCVNPKCNGWKWDKRKDLTQCQVCGDKFQDNEKNQNNDKAGNSEKDKADDEKVKKSEYKPDELDNYFTIEALQAIFASDERFRQSNAGVIVQELLSQLKIKYPPKVAAPVQPAPPTRESYKQAQKKVEALRAKTKQLEGNLTNKKNAVGTAKDKLAAAETAYEECHDSYQLALAEQRKEEASFHQDFPKGAAPFDEPAQGAAVSAPEQPAAAPVTPPGLDGVDIMMGVDESEDPGVKIRQQVVDKAMAELNGYVGKRRRVNDEAAHQQQKIDAEAAKVAADLAAAQAVNAQQMAAETLAKEQERAQIAISLAQAEALSAQQAAAKASAKEQEFAAHLVDMAAVSSQEHNSGDSGTATPTGAVATPTANGAESMIVADDSQENVEFFDIEQKGKGKGANPSARHSPM